MFKIQGRDSEYVFETKEGSVQLDGTNQSWDLSENGKNTYHIIKDNKSYNLDVVDADLTAKTFTIRVNGELYSLTAKDKFDELLEELGMDNLTSNQAEDLKAPMPGLVLDVKVEPGQEVTSSDVVLVLEAMKMENNIKPANEGVVKSIEIEKGQAVEKGQVLITFE